MDEQFIYVFSEDDKDKLIKSGHHLLVNDENNSIYVFASDSSIYFTLNGVKDYMKSNTLTL